jgi:hypothetical protein
MARLTKGLVLTATMFLVAGVLLIAQQTTKRLVLKDGSFQTVTRWEVVGDRVRYYSAERYGWEEVPNALIDWVATQKFNDESENQRTAMAKRIRDSAGKGEDEPADPEDASPTVAPGLRLPDGGGVFLLETYQEQPQLVELAQNGGELNRHTGRNILRAATNPLSLSAKQTIELKGDHAAIQSHVAQPAIYVNVESVGVHEPLARPSPSSTSSKDDWQGQRFGIIRLEKKPGLRVVGNLNVAVYGKVSQKANWIKTSSAVVGEWIKITPVETLPAGEYAIVELLEKDQINFYVWDFGVDPSAPANPNAWTARHSVPTQDSSPPKLERRPN